MAKENKKQKDLGLKVVSKEVAYWTGVKEQLVIQIEGLNNSLKYKMACLEMVKSKLSIAEKSPDNDFRD